MKKPLTTLKSAAIIWLIFCSHIFSQQVITADQSSNNTDEYAAQMEETARRSRLEWKRDSINKAVQLYSKSSDHWKSRKNHKRYAFCLRKIGQLKIILGEQDSAITFLQRALAISNLHNISDEKVKTQSILSLLDSHNGKINESQKKLEKAVKIANRIKDSSSQAFALSYTGEFYLYRKDPAEAIKFFEQSLEKWQKTNEPEGEANTLLLLGYAFIEQENFSDGLKCLEKSLSKWREVQSPRGQALTHIAFGLAYLMTNEKQKALDSYKTAEQIFPEDLDFFDKAILFNGLGAIYEEYGEWTISIKYRKNALDLYKRTNNLYGQLATLPSLAILSNLIGENENALIFSNQAESLAIQLNAPYYLAIIRKNLGYFFLESNEYEKAFEHFQLSLDYFKKSDFKREIALINNKLGELYIKQNKPEKAEVYLALAAEQNRKVQNKIAESQTLFNLAKLNFSNNNYENALDLCKQSLSLTESTSLDVLNSKLRQNYFSTVFDRYEFYVNLLMNSHKRSSGENFDLQALQAAEKSRARVMLENLSLSDANFTKDANSEMVKREKETRILLNAKADELTDLLSKNGDKSEIDKISDEINELENQLEEIKVNFKQNSPEYYAIKNPAPFDVGEFQKNVLDDDSLLLEFSFGNDESYLWLIEKTEFSSYILPPRERIESKIQILRELLASREKLKDESIENYQTRVKKADEEYSKIAKELSLELFGQVAGKFGNKRLIIVPDGKLGYFPVSALPLPNSEKNEPILLSNEVVYQPSASTLSILANNSKQINPASKSLLIFSDPVFSADDSRLSPENKDDLSANNETGEKFRFVESLNSLVRLDASKTEADSIIKILGESNADNFSGFSANRERLLDTNAADYKILHFATHGLIDESRPELSGIVLSRFDENGRKMDEFFRLHDIYGMNLKSDLVVLSACNTGIGKEVRGEGLMSLNNAFLSVGAKSVMSSLWKVEDGATLELMKNFYDAMANERLTPSKALQKAQIKMYRGNRYQSPFYWAAFTVQGDYRNVPDVSRGFGFWIYLLPVGVILFLVAFLSFGFIRRRNHK